MLRTAFKDGCNQHISLFKSEEDNQWIQPKGMLIKGLFPRRTLLVLHSMWLTFRKRRYWDPYCFLFHALEMYSYLLSFYMTTFALFSLYENPTNYSFHRILITVTQSGLSWADRYPVVRIVRNLWWIWHKQKLEGVMNSPCLGFRKSIPRALHSPLYSILHYAGGQLRISSTRSQTPKPRKVTIP